MNSGLNYEIIFMIATLGFAALTIAWTALALATPLGRRALLGLAASLLSTMLIGALWFADELHWVGTYIRAVPPIWLAALIANGLALVFGRGKHEPLITIPVTLALLAFVLHIVAGGTFLWMATMSV